MAENTPCSCGALRYNQVFACSGAADVDAIADQAARKLSREKTAVMGCAAALAAGIPSVLEKARTASKVLVLDGCDQECARKIVAQAGITEPVCVQLGTLGLEKGKSPVTEDCVAQVSAAAAKMLAQAAGT